MDARSRISPFSTEGISSRDAASAASAAGKETKPSPFVPLKNYGEMPDRNFGRKLHMRGADDDREIADMLGSLAPSESRMESKANAAKEVKEVESRYKDDSDDDRDEAPRRRGRSRLSKLGEMRRRSRVTCTNRDIDEEEEDGIRH